MGCSLLSLDGLLLSEAKQPRELTSAAESSVALELWPLFSRIVSKKRGDAWIRHLKSVKRVVASDLVGPLRAPMNGRIGRVKDPKQSVAPGDCMDCIHLVTVWSLWHGGRHAT